MGQPNIKPIGRREIKSIFVSNEFLERLSEAADITWETDHEIGFCVVRDIYKNKIIYGNVVGTDVKDPRANDPRERIFGLDYNSINPLLGRYDLKIYNNDVYPVIDIHFHPFPSNFEPSEQDIRYFLSKREDLFYQENYGSRIDCKPIFIVGSQPSSVRTIELLLLQETGKKPLGKTFAEILISSVEMDPQYYYDDHSTIARLYDKQEGIQVAMLSFERSNRLYKLKKGDYQKISKFASNPSFLGFAKYHG